MKIIKRSSTKKDISKKKRERKKESGHDPFQFFDEFSVVFLNALTQKKRKEGEIVSRHC